MPRALKIIAKTIGFRKNRQGIVTVMTAALLPTMAFAVMAGIEMTRLQTAKLSMQKHLDSAVLSCASRVEAMRRGMEGEAGEQRVVWRACMEDTFWKMAQEDDDALTLNKLTFDDSRKDEITATAFVTKDNFLSKLLNTDRIEISVTASAQIRRFAKLEIALALDVSASMHGAPFSAMKPAAVEFIETVFEIAGQDADITVSVFPFGDNVRFPVAYSRWLPAEYSKWQEDLNVLEQAKPNDADIETMDVDNQPHDPTNPFHVHQENNDVICLNGNKTRSTRTACIKPNRWIGCFADPDDDDITTKSFPAAPAFPPALNLMQNVQQSRRDKWMGYCPGKGSASLIMSRDQDEITTMIKGITQALRRVPLRVRDTGYGTGTDIGLSWAWRSLHPENMGKFIGHAESPAPFDKHTMKHLLLLTDGQPVGMARANDPNRSNTAKKNSTAICDAIKAQNTEDDTIHVWSIAFTKGAGGFRDELKKCKAGLGGFYDAGEHNISAVFKEIAKGIGQIRARLVN